MSGLLSSSLRFRAITSVSVCGGSRSSVSLTRLLHASASRNYHNVKRKRPPTQSQPLALPSSSKASAGNPSSSSKSSKSRTDNSRPSKHRQSRTRPSPQSLRFQKRREEKERGRLEELRLVQEQLQQRQTEFAAERDKGMSEWMEGEARKRRQKELINEMKAKMQHASLEHRRKALERRNGRWRTELDAVARAGTKQNGSESRKSVSSTVAEMGRKMLSWTNKKATTAEKPKPTATSSSSSSPSPSPSRPTQFGLRTSSASSRSSSFSALSTTPSSNLPPPPPSSPRPRISTNPGGLPQLKEFYRPPPGLHGSSPTSFTQRKGKLSAVSKTKSSLLTSFTSPPLLPGLVSCLHDVLGPQASPTEIQSLSIRKVVTSSEELDKDSPKDEEETQKYNEYLLASETGSGKSIAYLLPLLQSLKTSELRGFPSSSTTPRSPESRREYSPRSLILTPTHELARQLSGFAKTLSHEIKLKVVCASRANERDRKDRDYELDQSSRRQAYTQAMEIEGEEIAEGITELDVQPMSPTSLSGLEPVPGGRPVDVMVGTPMKFLDMTLGRGWDREDRRGGKPEMGLGDVEWVVVDEADVLFDPDFNSYTRLLLSEISKARGEEVAFVKEDPTLSAECYPEAPEARDDSTSSSTQASKSPSPATASAFTYPFNLFLTTATIPPALSSYLQQHHPSMTRLSSSGLHKLPSSLKIEKIEWTGGNKYADIEKRLKGVWMEDERRSALGLGPESSSEEVPGMNETQLSKVIIFCNKSTKVEELGTYLEGKGIKTVTLTSKIASSSSSSSSDDNETGEYGDGDGKGDEQARDKDRGDRKSSERRRGSNKHLEGFLRVRQAKDRSLSNSNPEPAGSTPSTKRLEPLVVTSSRSKSSPSSPGSSSYQNPLSVTPHVLLTTSLLSRGLDFSPSVRHVFIVDEPRNVVDFLHRAGRTGRAGGDGVVVVFGKGKGKGKDFGWRGGRGNGVLEGLKRSREP